MIGQILAHYRILGKAGSGGMGVVYRARDETLERDVALKVLTPGANTPGNAREALLREARACSALNHPNICTVYEVGEADQQAYIAMEFVEGESLNRRIPADGLPTETVLQYGIEIASALEHAHERGILHRDLKGANIRVTPSGQVKVLDFGLAARIRQVAMNGATVMEDSALETGTIVGTPAYMAPETLRGAPADMRSDIWSLGVLLYEMAQGTPPFQGRTKFELTTAILREPPAPLSPHVSPGLRAIITRCLSKQPEQRYQRASEVRAALEALQSQGHTAVGQAVAPQGSRAGLLAAVGIAVLALVVAGIVVLRRKPPGGPGLPTAAEGTLRLLLSSQVPLGGPALSPDGKMIAYIEDKGRHPQLYVTRISGGDRVQLTNDDSAKADPQFAPDGEHVAFARRKPNQDSTEICIVPTLGGQPLPIVANASRPAWSPDGNRLAFVERQPGKAETLSSSAADGAGLKVLLEGDAEFPFFGQPSWSPDGSTIAVARSRGGASRQVWLLPLAGGPARPLTHDPAGVYSDDPVFSPDGRGVIHRSSRGGAPNLWWQPIDGGPPVRLTSGPGPDYTPSVSRNGAIAFRNSRSHGIVFLMELLSGKISTLISDREVLWAPAFSPDGKEIAYSRSETDGAWHIWIVSASGGTPEQFTRGKASEVYPRYAPGGQTILFHTWGAEKPAIWRALRNGSPPAQLKFAGASSDSYADISKDGRWIAFARVENEASHVYISPMDGSAPPRRLTEGPSAVPRWSPDGKWITFSADRDFFNGIWLVRSDGTELRRLTDTGGWPVWWPDGTQIGFQGIGANQNEEIRIFSLKTGKVTVLRGLDFDGINFPFDLSPDGKRLVSTNSVHDTDEIWLLEPPKK